jgi:hypothetical protein
MSETNIDDTCVMCSNSNKTSKDKQYPKYCGNHQRDAWVNDMMSQGKKVCSRNNRGCRNTMDPSFRFSKCDNCRNKENEEAKKRAPRTKKDHNPIPVKDNELPIKKTQNVKSRDICAGFEKDKNRTKCILPVELKLNAKFCQRHSRLEMFTPEELHDIGSNGGIIKQCTYIDCSNYHKTGKASCDVCLAKSERQETLRKIDRAKTM